MEASRQARTAAEAMRHPDSVANLLRPRSTWRDISERGSRGHDAWSWEDAAHLLGTAPPLVWAAFMLRYSDEPPARLLLNHLVAIAARELGDASSRTPEHLVGLLVIFERGPEDARTVANYARRLEVTRGEWRWRYQRPFARVSTELDTLNSDAWQIIVRRAGE
jgi:hypothetical protein